MRASAYLLIAALAGCHPSATVEHTMPVANLQSYRTVALRVHATTTAQQAQASLLERWVFARVKQQCGFEKVGTGATAADVVIDLNVTGGGRGGNGFIQNANLATLDTLLVLTDGGNGELLGTARIHGKSSGIVINNTPENEAADIVGKTVADLLAKSGCSGPRVAKVEPTTTVDPGVPGSGSAANQGSASVDQGSAAVAVPDESHRAEADALNAQGSEKLQRADLPGALAAFQQANTLLPDARYEFNVCLTLEAQEQWDNAIAACRQARTMNPQPKLVAKIDHRLDLLQHHQ